MSYELTFGCSHTIRAIRIAEEFSKKFTPKKNIIKYEGNTFMKKLFEYL